MQPAMGREDGGEGCGGGAAKPCCHHTPLINNVISSAGNDFVGKSPRMAMKTTRQGKNV